MTLQKLKKKQPSGKQSTKFNKTKLEHQLLVKERKEDGTIKGDLIYWSKKFEIFKKNNSIEGIKICRMMLDFYLDKFNTLKLHELKSI